MRYAFRLALATAFTATTLALVSAPPASADNCDFDGQSGALEFGGSANCPNNSNGSNGTGNSGNNGNNDPRTPPTGKFWHYIPPSLGECGTNGNLYRGYTTWGPNGPVVDPPSDAALICIEPSQPVGNQPQGFIPPPLPPIEALRAQARLMLKPGEIVSDYKQQFLFRADTHLSALGISTMQEPLNVPGYHVWLEATPSSFVWDFGDGTTGSGAEVVHRYDSKSSISNGTASAKVKVSLQVVWNGQLHVNQINLDGTETPVLVDQLGSVPVESSIERSIIEVWAAAVPPPQT